MLLLHYTMWLSLPSVTLQHSYCTVCWHDNCCILSDFMVVPAILLSKRIITVDVLIFVNYSCWVLHMYIAAQSRLVGIGIPIPNGKPQDEDGHRLGKRALTAKITSKNVSIDRHNCYALLPVCRARSYTDNTTAKEMFSWNTIRIRPFSFFCSIYLHS